MYISAVEVHGKCVAQKETHLTNLHKTYSVYVPYVGVHEY